jgi:cytochrome d ubiquinol oxidase subunit II
VFLGIALVLICALHGLAFMTLKTDGEMAVRCRQLGRRLAPLVALVVLVLAFWTHAIADRGVVPNLWQATSVITALAAIWLLRDGAVGWAFTATTLTIASVILSIFEDLYPRLMVSSSNPSFDLTVSNSASGSYALKVMTVVTVVLLPVVLVYQAWTYYVFRTRLRREDFAVGHEPPPTDATVASVPSSRPPA